MLHFGSDTFFLLLPLYLIKDEKEAFLYRCTAFYNLQLYFM